MIDYDPTSIFLLVFCNVLDLSLPPACIHLWAPVYVKRRVHQKPSITRRPLFALRCLLSVRRVICLFKSTFISAQEWIEYPTGLDILISTIPLIRYLLSWRFDLRKGYTSVNLGFVWSGGLITSCVISWAGSNWCGSWTFTSHLDKFVRAILLRGRGGWGATILIFLISGISVFYSIINVKSTSSAYRLTKLELTWVYVKYPRRPPMFLLR